MPSKRKKPDPFNEENREWRTNLNVVTNKKTLKTMKKIGVVSRPTAVAMGIAEFNKKYGD